METVTKYAIYGCIAKANIVRGNFTWKLNFMWSDKLIFL